ncbi:MAG TPA: IS1595 family transposase [Croceibacterium sp.]|nr:IS1595 family transposase [Croceibacterium sp.]
MCCGRYLSAIGGTILARSNARVRPWLYALLLYADSVTGLSHNSLRRLLGLSQGAADRLADGLRTHIALSLIARPLGGPGMRVYIDECLLRLARASERVVVLGLTDGERCVLRIIPNRKAATLLPVIVRQVAPGSTIVTDGWAGYNGVGKLGFAHSRVNHTSKLWVNHDGDSTAPIEGQWTVIKRLLKGRAPFMSSANMWKFVGEAMYRYDARFDQAAAWWRLVGAFPVLGPGVLEAARRRIDLR